MAQGLRRRRKISSSCCNVSCIISLLLTDTAPCEALAEDRGTGAALGGLGPGKALLSLSQHSLGSGWDFIWCVPSTSRMLTRLPQTLPSLSLFPQELPGLSEWGSPHHGAPHTGMVPSSGWCLCHGAPHAAMVPTPRCSPCQDNPCTMMVPTPQWSPHHPGTFEQLVSVNLSIFPWKNIVPISHPIAGGKGGRNKVTGDSDAQ